MVEYVHVSAGVIDRSPGSLPKYWERGVVEPPSGEPPLDTVKAFGWLPVVKTSDSIDPETQKLGDVQITIGADQVVFHRPAVSLTVDEVSARGVASAKTAVSDILLRVELLKLELLMGIANSLDPAIVSGVSQKSQNTITFVQNHASKI